MSRVHTYLVIERHAREVLEAEQVDIARAKQCPRRDWTVVPDQSCIRRDRRVSLIQSLSHEHDHSRCASRRPPATADRFEALVVVLNREPGLDDDMVVLAWMRVRDSDITEVLDHIVWALWSGQARDYIGINSQDLRAKDGRAEGLRGAGLDQRVSHIHLQMQTTRAG